VGPCKGGRERALSFPTEDDANKKHRQLLVAKDNNEQWDQETGLPESLQPKEVAPKALTFFEHTVMHVKRKWPEWKARSRSSAIEALKGAVCAFTDAPIPERLVVPARSYLEYVALRPEPWRDPTVTELAAAEWLTQHSLPLTAISAQTVERALSIMNTRLDGTGPVATTTRNRYRNTLHHCFKMAGRGDLTGGLTIANPMDNVDTSMIKRGRAVDKTTIPSMDQALELIDLACARSQSKHGRAGTGVSRRERLRAWYLTMLFAGLRPEEVAHLREPQLDLPADDTQWGTIRVFGGTVTPGARWTTSGQSHDDQGQKWRDDNAPARLVPIPPRLCKALRLHMSLFPPSGDGRVFVTRRNQPITHQVAGDAFREARSKRYPVRLGQGGTPLPAYMQVPLHDVTLYDLRHTCATVWLRAARTDPTLNEAEVARRLGHTLDELHEVYAGFTDDDLATGNAAISATLDRLVSR
jgi:integrase